MSQYEFEAETFGHEAEAGEFGEFGEFGQEAEYGEYGEYGQEAEFGEFGHDAEFGEFGQEAEFGEFGQEAEFGEFGESGHEAEYQETMEAESPLTEVQEVELAGELLEITNEQELEQFLGGLIKGVGGFMKSPAGRALGGILKNVAKKALPVVGGALGSFVAPGVGTAIGSKLGSMASNLFELELEGVDREQAEFEVARRYVRFATAAARNASLAPASLPPSVIANRAVAAAARRYAPGLLRGGRRRRRGGVAVYGDGPAYVPQYGYGDGDGGNGDVYGSRPRTGRWVRRGRKVVLYGL
jgi:uncharacterized protein (DUF697 family)